MAAQTEEDAMTVQTKTSRRILSFDLIRGYLLAMIMVDHIELYPNFFGYFTGEGRLFVSAAEGFFFLSGLLLGIVYRRRLAKGLGFIFRKMWARAAELYIASVGFTLLYTFWAFKTSAASLKYGLYPTQDWHQILVHSLSMRYQYGWADFLYRFVILMLIAPFAFWLISKGKWWLVLAASVAAWIFRDNNFILAWQIIFINAMSVGFYWDRINAWVKSIAVRRRKNIKKTLIILTLVTFAISYASAFLLSLLNNMWLSNSLPRWLQHVTYDWNNYNYDIWLYTQKWTMGPLRIALFALWGFVLYLWTRKHEMAINERTKGILELLGRNSLFVYSLHSVIAFGFQFLDPDNTNFIVNSGITLLSLFMLIIATKLYVNLKSNWPNLNSSGLYGFIYRKSKSLLLSSR